MKRVLVILAAATLVLTLATGTAVAGKHKHHKKPKHPTTEVVVTDWAGEITGAAGPNEYVFVPVDITYGTSIILDCGPAWYKVVMLANGPATVTGEIEKSKDGATELGAQSVTDSTGTLFEIKGADKPPWAGGPGGHGKPATTGAPDAD